ncbi:mitochondrial nucleoid-associated protein 1 isoform X1 [Oryctolagus cuniculus]|uniref:mitochondrial nucleoid-associated protein 1 isoform X1 n=1 Tax=Oryctolagus cuniculus TaxID=9986 RepID=UPI00387945EC
MSDNQPRMEVCPFCKKPFKRLKSHLPYCKMLGATLPGDQNVQQSKPTTPARTKKVKEPLKDLIKAKGRKLESEGKNTKLIRDKPAQTNEPPPGLAVGSERASTTTKPDQDISHQTQLSFRMSENTEPKVSFHPETEAQFYAPEGASPRRGLGEDLPKSEGRRCSPPEAEASLLAGSLEPFLSNQGRKYPSAAQTTSADLKRDTADAPRQGLLVEPLDVPVGGHHSSPKTLHEEANGARLAAWSGERGSAGRARLCAISADGRDTETRREDTESLMLALKISPLGKTQVQQNQEKGLTLGAEACGSKGNAEAGVSGTGVQEWTSTSSFKTGDSAIERISRDEGLHSPVFTPREKAHDGCLSVLQSRNQSLTSLAIRVLQEEKAGGTRNRVPDVGGLMDSKGPGSLDRRSGQALPSGCQQSLQSAQPHVSKSPFFSHVDPGERKTLPSSMGLEWFPELYPAYLGLGVLPEKPQYRNAVVQTPQLISPEGAGHSQVPLLERSSTDVSVEPPPGFSLQRLLGAVQQGWIRYSATVRQRGVGGITMLFTGYFILCCRWSFRHLKLQRWRKQC